MKILWLFLFAVFYAFRPSLGHCQTMPSPSPVETPLSPEQSLYRFNSQTVWGRARVLVQDEHGRFQVTVESDSAVGGWVLKEEKSSQTLSKGGLNPSNQFTFDVNQSFQGPYRLTLYLNSEHEQVPVLIRLDPQKADKDGKNQLTAGVEDFQDNPDRPYNNMVKNFYQEAVGSYSKGDNLHAVEFLEKARDLDPLQPQVQTFLEKIQGPKEKTSTLLDKVREAMKKGNSDEALAKLDDYLEEHPDDSEALELKDKIDVDHSPEIVKKTVVKLKKTKAVKTPVPEKTEELQAKADQAYNLGLDSYRQGDYAAAKKFWEETLEFQPTNLQAQRNLQRLKDEHPELK